MNVCTKVHGNLSNSSHIPKNVNFMVLDKKNRRWLKSLSFILWGLTDYKCLYKISCQSVRYMLTYFALEQSNDPTNQPTGIAISISPKCIWVMQNSYTWIKYSVALSHLLTCRPLFTHALLSEHGYMLRLISNQVSPQLHHSAEVGARMWYVCSIHTHTHRRSLKLLQLTFMTPARTRFFSTQSSA